MRDAKLADLSDQREAVGMIEHLRDRLAKVQGARPIQVAEDEA